MPNRYVREGINSSRAVASLDAATEIFYRRMLHVVDDFGRFEVDTMLIRSRAYPVHQGINEGDISRWLAGCEKAGLIVFYEAAGRRYLVLTKVERPRAAKPKFPEPPARLVERFGLFTPANTCLQTKTNASFPNTDTDTNPNAGAEQGRARDPVGEVPTEAQAVEMTVNAAIPPDFVRLVYLDWFSRNGRDGAGNVVAWLPYVTKRWAREQVEWKAGTHRGRKAKSPGQAMGPPFLEVAAYAREKWANDPRRANWAVSFHRHWSDPKREWKRNGVVIDWKIELTAQVAKWREQEQQQQKQQ